MKNSHKIILASVFGVLLLVGVSRAESLFDWGAVYKWAGYFIAEKVDVPKSVLKVGLEPDQVGGAGDTYSVKSSASKSITTLVATTSLYNATTVTRTIDRIVYSASTTAGAPGTSVHFAISADGITALTDLATSSTVANASASYVVTSTFATVSQREWKPGMYVIAYTLQAVSTTAGFVGVEYFNN